MADDRDIRSAADNGISFASRQRRYGDLIQLNVDRLQDLAAKRGIQGRARMGKDELLEALARGWD